MSMPIESRSSGERRTRLLIFLAMCGGFSGWFAYDGTFKYPRENLKQVLRDMPAEKPSDLQFNPRVNDQPLRIIQQRLVEKRLTTQKELEELLGSPTWDQPEELTYLGTQSTVVIRIVDDKVVSIASTPVNNPPPAETANYLVRPDRVGKVQSGMSRAELREILGKPSKTRERTLWYIGPAAHATFPIADGKVTGEPVIQRSVDHSESDIFMQKVLAGILAVVALFFVFKLFRVIQLRIVLDDDGLQVNGKRIAWDAMTALKTDDYLRKGWVDLVYDNNGHAKQYRLDSYHISHFKELVQAICERKGFSLPVATVSAER